MRSNISSHSRFLTSGVTPGMTAVCCLRRLLPVCSLFAAARCCAGAISRSTLACPKDRSPRQGARLRRRSGASATLAARPHSAEAEGLERGPVPSYFVGSFLAFFFSFFFKKKLYAGYIRYIRRVHRSHNGVDPSTPL